MFFAYRLSLPDKFPRRIFFGIAVVLVAGGAGRGLVEHPVNMTVGAFHITVGRIQHQAGHGMAEILAIPPFMAVLTFGIDLGDTLAGRMTGPAIQALVIFCQRPAGAIVSERRAFPVIVTF